MITKMKKLTFLIYYKEYEAFLKRMQELGVLHVQTAQEGSVEPTSELEAKLKQTEHVKAWINRLEAMEATDVPLASDRSATDILLHLDEMDEARRVKETELQRLRKDEAALLPWGDFDPVRVEGLSDIGYAMGFFVCPERSFNEEWAELYYATEVTREKGKVYFVTLTPVGEEVVLDAERLRLPHVSLADLRKQIREKEEGIAAIEHEMGRLAQGYVSRLRGYEDELRTSIAFDRVVLGTEQVADNRLMVLQGWIPEDKEAEVKSFLSTQEVYYEIRAARREDNAPIKLKNNAFVRMYEVLTKMYGMPDYAEFDPTPLVAPFFTLFFAFCMGDAGYGLVLIALGFFLKHKLSPSLKGIMNLVITLGAATTVFGAVLGTFFGVSLFDVDIPEWMKQFMIVGKIGDTSYDKQMLLALIIGVVHICIAMTVKAIGATVRYGFKESLSDWGWLLLVVGFICTGGLSFMKVISENVAGTSFLVIGSVAAIVLVKELFGGIGGNFMNPALTARAILMISWPVAMTSYTLPVYSLMPGVDAVSSATVLGGLEATPMAMFLGMIPGAIGEVSKVAILVGLVYMLLRKVISWHIPVIYVGSFALLSWILGNDVLSALLSGGILFGAVFMAPDYTTSPMTKKGQAVYAIGCGVMTCIIRNFGSYPEGVTFAILLMNIATPLIDKYMGAGRVYGKGKK